MKISALAKRYIPWLKNKKISTQGSSASRTRKFNNNVKKMIINQLISDNCKKEISNV